MPTKAGPIFQCWQRKAFIPYLKTSIRQLASLPSKQPTFTICLVASTIQKEMVLLLGAKKGLLSNSFYTPSRLLYNTQKRAPVKKLGPLPQDHIASRPPAWLNMVMPFQKPALGDSWLRLKKRKLSPAQQNLNFKAIGETLCKCPFDRRDFHFICIWRESFLRSLVLLLPLGCTRALALLSLPSLCMHAWHAYEVDCKDEMYQLPENDRGRRSFLS